MKTPSYAVLLALILPASLAAQQTPAGPPANPITTVFRARTLALQRNLAQAFDSIPERLFVYKPTPAQLSIGYIAQHLASDNYFFCNNFGDMKATVAAEDTATADSVKATWPKARLMAKLKRVVRVLRERVRAARRCEAGRPDHPDVPRPVAAGPAREHGAGPRRWTWPTTTARSRTTCA